MQNTSLCLVQNVLTPLTRICNSDHDLCHASRSNQTSLTVAKAKDSNRFPSQFRLVNTQCYMNTHTHSSYKNARTCHIRSTLRDREKRINEPINILLHQWSGGCFSVL